MNIGGDSIYYEFQDGSKPCVVLCDGLGCDGFIWRYLKKELADHKVLHVHYRGHGRSPVPRSNAVSVEQLAADIEIILRREKIAKTSLIGHSLGVQVALQIATTCPELVSKLVLLCGASQDLTSHFYRGIVPMKKVLPYMRKAAEKMPLFARRLGNSMFASRFSLEVAKLFEVDGDRVHDADLKPYFRGLARMDPRVFWSLLDSAADFAIENPKLISIPSIVVAGTHDKFVPVEESRKLAEVLPKASFHVIPGGSHITPIEFPREVGDLVMKFMENADQI